MDMDGPFSKQNLMMKKIVITTEKNFSIIYRKENDTQIIIRHNCSAYLLSSFFFRSVRENRIFFYNNLILLLYIPLPFSDNIYICLRQVMEGRNGNGAKKNNKSSVRLGDLMLFHAKVRFPGFENGKQSSAALLLREFIKVYVSVYYVVVVYKIV